MRVGARLSLLIGPYHSGIVVESVAIGSAAEVADVRPRDVIESVDGLSFEGITLADARKMLAKTSLDVSGNRVWTEAGGIETSSCLDRHLCLMARRQGRQCVDISCARVGLLMHMITACLGTAETSTVGY